MSTRWKHRSNPITGSADLLVMPYNYHNYSKEFYVQNSMTGMADKAEDRLMSMYECTQV
jgi:hypothetical protein